MKVDNSLKELKLNQDIEIIIKVISENFKDHLISIILYGSYGRDEGSFFQKDNKTFTYNDYDLIIVVNNLLSNNELVRIKQNLQKSLDIQWIDLSQKTINKLCRLKPTIFNFDLKYGSKVLWGDEKILDYIPEFESENIGLKEAETLFFTRMFTFLGSIDNSSFGKGVQEENARFFRNQMAKAILAVVDTLLIQKKAYHQSYKERVKRIEELYPEKKEFNLLAKWALEEKMFPKDEPLNGKETEDFHRKVLVIFLDEMKIALSQLYKKKIRSIEDLRKAKYFSINELIYRLKDIIISKSLFSYEKKFCIQIAQAYLAEALVVSETKKFANLQKVAQIVNRLKNTSLESRDLNWDMLRANVVKLRLGS